MRTRLSQFRSLLGPRTLKPGTSGHRWQGVVRAAGAGIVAKVVSMGSQLVLVPLLLAYLGAEGFGLWATIAGAFLFLGLADLGLGFGLQNRVARAIGKDAPREIASATLSTMAVLLLVGVCITVFGLLVIRQIDLVRLLGVVELPNQRTAELSVALALAGFSVGLPLSVSQKIAQGLQLGWANGFAQGASAVLVLTGALMFGFLGLPAMVAITVGSPILANAILLGWLCRQGHVSASQARLDMRLARQILHAGFLFVPINLGTVALNHFPVLAITSQLGAVAAVPFVVAQRLMGLFTQTQGVLMGPFWPAFAEASARGDHAWIQINFLRILRVTAVIGLVAMGLWYLLGDWAILLWSGDTAAVPTSTFLAWQAVFGFTALLATTLSSLLNALQHLRGQAVAVGISSVVTLVAAGPVAGAFGIEGVMAVLAVSYSIPIVGILLPETLRHASLLRQPT